MNSLFTYRFEVGGRTSSRDILMIFTATPELDSKALATAVEADVEANLVPDELLIIVRDPVFQVTRQALKVDPQNIATLGRLQDRATVTLVSYGCAGEESQRVHVMGPKAPRHVKFKDLRRRAITSIFNAHRGFVESTSTYHFENPSGRHTERFIRLSNILVRGAEIAFIGFCTLPFVREPASTAYVDTPSLYAVIAAINEQRASFGAKPILADNFASYSGVLAYQFTQIDDALILISASSSGSLAQRLIQNYGFSPDRVTHLLFLGTDKSGSNIVCDLRNDSDVNPEGAATLPVVENAKSCRICATGSHAIKLHGDQFEFAGPQQESLRITKNDAPKSLAKLMDRLAGGKLFRIGLDKKTSRHPRQFNIEPDALLACTEFQKHLGYALRRSIPASHKHIIAADDSSKQFAEVIANAIDRSAAVIGREALDTIPDNTESALVIAAVVIESGRTLLDISRDLRSIAPKAPLLYLVGFSKTTGEPRRESLERTLVQTTNAFPYQLIEIERMVLPLSSDNNAWAAELNLLINPEVSALIPPTLKATIDARILRLRKMSEALLDDLFVPNALDRTLRLQPGFVFWPDDLPGRQHSQADVFFTIASVLQQLRANAHRTVTSAIKSNWFQQTILAPENFGRFNDDIIQASILRAAYPFEMNYADAPKDSHELGRLIRRIIMASSKDRGGAAAEFLIALATQRMRLRPDDVETVLSADPGEVPLVRFLQTVCRKQFATNSEVSESRPS